MTKKIIPSGTQLQCEARAKVVRLPVKAPIPERVMIRMWGADREVCAVWTDAHWIGEIMTDPVLEELWEEEAE